MDATDLREVLLIDPDVDLHTLDRALWCWTATDARQYSRRERNVSKASAPAPLLRLRTAAGVPLRRRRNQLVETWQTVEVFGPSRGPYVRRL